MVEINLLPQGERRRSGGDGWKVAALALLPLTAAAILIPEWLVGSQINKLKAEQALLQGEIAALTPTNAGEMMAVQGRGGASVQVARANPLISNLGHNWEHYGNLVTYLRAKGIVPPSSDR